jgi:hypothetical protein
MKYIEVEARGITLKLPASHPYLLELQIDPVDWHRFSQLSDDNSAVRIIGHDEADDGLMTVRVACASEAVVDRLSDAW